MAETKLKFEIGSVFNGEGFQRAQKALDNTAKGVQKAAGGMAAISGELGQLNGTVGKVAGGLSGLLGSLSAGPWGIAAAGIGLVVSLFVKWRNSIEESRKAHDELMSKMADGYKRRLAIYAEKAHKAEIAALDAIITKGRQAIDIINNRAAAYRNLATSEDAISKAGDRLAMANASGDKGMQITITNNAARRAADRNVTNIQQEVLDLTDKIGNLRTVIETMRKKGEDTFKAEQELASAETALTAANNNLAAAQIEREAVIKESQNREKALQDERNKAIEAETEAKRKKAEADEKEAKAAEKLAMKNEAEAAIKAAEASGNERVSAIDAKIAAVQQEFNTWEEAAKSMRGKNFTDWMSEEAAAGNEGEAFKKANAKAARRARQIRRDARHGWASAGDREWLAKYDQWNAAQDAGNNPAADRLKQLQEQREQAVIDMKSTVEDIRDYLQQATEVS